MRERSRRCLAEEEEDDDKAATCMGLVDTFILLIQSAAPKAIFSFVLSALEAYPQVTRTLSHKLRATPDNKNPNKGPQQIQKVGDVPEMGCHLTFIKGL